MSGWEGLDEGMRGGGGAQAGRDLLAMGMIRAARDREPARALCSMHLFLFYFCFICFDLWRGACRAATLKAMIAKEMYRFAVDDEGGARSGARHVCA